ncbi:recombinase family protein [Nonomuraea typhae]|uniref:Recombinase family protein n=1 Tax=Nonomuraea typhae TaxID=2603600 RepID=A0ABW7YKQ5_9ACTN
MTNTPSRLALYLRESKSKTGQEVRSQEGAGRRWAAANDCVIPEDAIYIDDDRSASTYARKAREEFERLMADIDAGLYDLVWFWSLSRSQRRLDMYVRLRDLCRARGVNWVINRKRYDLSNPMDLQSLGISAVNDEVFSVQLSDNVRRGLQESAVLGRPHSHTTYGYRRVYEGRDYVEQVPDDDAREATRADGTVTRYSPAKVVEEIITRFSKGDFNARITRSLEERGIPAPQGGPKWSRSVVRKIATNRAYLGIRVMNGQDAAHGSWPALVEPDVFEAAQEILNNPKRTTTRPGRAEHLMSYLARCQCGEVMQNVPGYKGKRNYSCLRRDASVPARELDTFVRQLVDGYLARPDVAAFLAKGSAATPEAAKARAKVSALRAEITKLETALDSGDESVDALDVARALKPLRARLSEAVKAAEKASTPSILRGAVDWEDIAVARQIVAAVVEITIRPVGKGAGSRSGGVPIEQRVGWRWLLGPDQAK